MERRERSPREELEKARQRLIDYGEKAPLDSIQWQAFEDNVDLTQAISSSVPIDSEQSSLEQFNRISNKIAQKSENPEYLSEYDHVASMLENFVELNGNQLRTQFGTFAQSRRPRFLSFDVTAKELTRIKDRIKERGMRLRRDS
jgi:hypothetical protein